MTAVTGSLLDDLPCGFVAFADDGTVRLVNKTLIGMLERTHDDIVGRHFETMMSVGSKIFYQTHLFPLLRLQHHVEEIFLTLRTGGGEEIGVLLNAARRRRGGEFVTDCVLMRVRERQKFEDALVRARQQADAARVEADARATALAAANDELERQAVELELTQQQISEQTTELEVQSESLRALNDQLIQHSAELEKQRAIADEANRAKSTFLASMSHELRTPLNAIGGYVQLLEMGIHGPLSEGQLDALRKVLRSQRHLLRLINEVLNLSRIEAGAVHYDLKRVAVREIVGAVVPMVEPQLAEKRLTLAVTVPETLFVRADHDKAEQILLNLLGNALKFTRPDGSISIAAHRDADGEGVVRIDVIDTGIGVPAERLEEIFEPFVQVDTSPAGTARGTGLGLAISRDLAHGMGGDLTAASQVGEGSTFTLVLPAG